MTSNHLFILFLFFINNLFITHSKNKLLENLELLDDLYDDYYDNDYYDKYYDDDDEYDNDYDYDYDYDYEDDEEIDEMSKETSSSIYDYTLYFNDYNFNWDKEDDWDKINIINHKDGETPYQEIEACTFEIASIQKRVCVHSKQEGGFTINFKGSPKSHRSLLIEEEEEDDSLSDFYDNIELDWDNDADWSQISHTFSDYDENDINTKYMNDLIQLKYANNLLTEYKATLENFKQVFYQNYGVYPNEMTDFNQQQSSAKAAHMNLLNNYADYGYYDDIEFPATDPFTQEMADTLSGSGGDDMYNLYGTAATMGGASPAMMGMGSLMQMPGAKQMFPGMNPPQGASGYPGMNNPYSPQGPYGQQMINSMKMGVDASKYVYYFILLYLIYFTLQGSRICVNAILLFYRSS